MNQITINRLIGGGVLVFTGALFVPAILSPTKNALQNPKFSVSVEKIEPVAPKPDSISLASSSIIPKNNEAKPFALESLANPSEVKKTQNTNTANVKPNNTKSKKLMKVSLESVSDAKKPLQMIASKTGSKTKLPTSASWLRVGSFSTQKNAEKVTKALKSARYPVKIETVTVSGQTFRRVLVGPFSDEKKMAKIMKGIKARGYNPSVQR